MLAEYGYDVRDSGGREQQFACDLHGDGLDGIPSARVYPGSNDWYCFGCQITRDAIATVRANTDLDFFGALKLLETKWGLQPLPWSDDDRRGGPREPSTRSVVEATLREGKTFADDAKSFRKMLDGEVRERDITVEYAVTYWEAFDKILWHVKEGSWDEKTGRIVLAQLRQRYDAVTSC